MLVVNDSTIVRNCSHYSMLTRLPSSGLKLPLGESQIAVSPCVCLFMIGSFRMVSRSSIPVYFIIIKGEGGRRKVKVRKAQIRQAFPQSSFLCFIIAASLRNFSRINKKLLHAVSTSRCSWLGSRRVRGQSHAIENNRRTCEETHTHSSARTPERWNASNRVSLVRRQRIDRADVRPGNLHKAMVLTERRCRTLGLRIPWPGTEWP